MRHRIKQIIRGCDVCQKTKFPNRYLEGRLQSIVDEHPGNLVTVNYYGPLPAGRGKVSYILVIIDAFSKFVKLYPLKKLNGSPNPLFDCVLPYLTNNRTKKSVQTIRQEVRSRLQQIAESVLNHSRHNDKLNIGDIVLLRQPSISNASEKYTTKFALLYSGPNI